jgi:AraC family transcriptional regulator
VGRRPSASARLEYDRRVNRVIDHIRGHLAEPLTLDELARVAAFSPFHFDRVFKAVAGETLFGFVQRVRVDRAASALLARCDASVLEIALDHGFASAATFARAFRARFGMSATRWRAGGGARWRARHGRNPGKQLRNLRKAGGRRARNTRERKEGAMSVRVQQQPAYHVAYMRYGGPFGPGGIPELWQRFNRWRAAHDLFRPDSLTLGVTNDDPGISGDKARYDACVVVSREFAPDRLVNVMDIPAGTYAVADFVGTAHDIVPAWERVFAAWLPGSGYQPDDRPCYELYRGDPTVDGAKGGFRCDLCLPVRPL